MLGLPKERVEVATIKDVSCTYGGNEAVEVDFLMFGTVRDGAIQSLRCEEARNYQLENF